VEKGVNAARAAAAMESGRGVPSQSPEETPCSVGLAVDEAAVRNYTRMWTFFFAAPTSCGDWRFEQEMRLYRHTAGLEHVLEGPSAAGADAVNIIFAAEKVGRDNLHLAPEVGSLKCPGSFRLVNSTQS